MNCPNCGTPEKARVKVCPSCGEAYASQDLLELERLVFLIKETASWDVANALRYPYEERLRELRERLEGVIASQPQPVVEPTPLKPPEQKTPSIFTENMKIVLSGPGEMFSVIGKLGKGDFAEVTGVSPGRKWWLIRVPESMSPDNQGWVSADQTTAYNVDDVPVIQLPKIPVESSMVTEKSEIASETSLISETVLVKEKVPFDQWLLSERNIKIALYAGGALLVIAGLIFIGVNWTRIPGPAKFAITLMITGLMYLAGYLLFQRPAYRIGGVALLAIASGFFTLNFAVLQIYVLGPNGLQNNVMWLIASPICLLLYILTTYWTKSDLFTYISILALYSTTTAALVVAHAPTLLFALLYAVLALLMLLLAIAIRKSDLSSFTYLPLIIVSQIMIAITFIGSLFSIGGPINVIFDWNHGSEWLAEITMMIGVTYYLLNAYYFRHVVFTYACLITLGCAVIGFLNITETPLLVGVMSFAILALGLLLLSYYLQKTSIAEFTRQPCLVLAQLVIPIVILACFAGWGFNLEYPWLAITSLLLAVVFYALTDIIYHWLAVRWVAAFLLPITLVLLMFELHFGDTAIAITLMILSGIYLGIGYFIQPKDERKFSGWPLFAVAYIMALLVTVLAIPQKTSDLIIILIADVIILVLSAAIHHSYWWVYGSVWLFMLPIYLTISLFVPRIEFQGLIMGVLGLNYLVAGYVLGRKEIRFGGPFLSAVVFLSILITGMTWINPMIASLMMVVIAILYILAALWLDWNWLLFPALISVNLTVLSINTLVFNHHFQAPFFRSLTLSYFLLGMVITLCAWGLRRLQLNKWSWPLYIVGAINLSLAYLASLGLGGWIALSVSIVFATMLLAFSWLEKDIIMTRFKFALLTYLGIAAIFIGHYFGLELVFGERMIDLWPAFTAGLCAIFMLLAWLLRNQAWNEIYAMPLRYAGLWLLIIPSIGSISQSVLDFSEPTLVAVTFGIAGIVYAFDASMRKNITLAYLSSGAFLIVVWAVLFALHIYEPQAYIIPPGLALLGGGWYERLKGNMSWYRAMSMSGLILLMGSALVQSILNASLWYAILLIIECLAAITWGIITHSRCFVQFGGIALIANAVIQLGPGFIDLERWIQLGVTGGILLAIGLVALFKRENILEMRSKLTNEWREWAP